jgi:flagella basal body P-ring formation protein FlgA
MKTLLIRLIFSLALIGVFAIRPAHAAAPQAVLKATIIVEGEKVTLGDLFDASAFAEAPEAAHVAVLAAPKPGDTVMLDALALRRFAAQQRIDWPNTQALTSIKIERAGMLIGADAIEKTLREGIEAQGVDGKMGIRLSGAMPALYIATGTQPSLSLEKLSIDKTTGQFQATLRAPADSPAGDTAKVTGRIYAITELPVTIRDIKPGETITERDLILTEMQSEKLGQNVLTAASDLVGRAPKRMIRAGQPLRLGDVEAPILVRKDAIVTMTMRTPGMTLTAEGRALENGAAGDTIKVMNTNSKRMIIATVEGDGQVSVGRAAPSPLAANFATPAR